MNKSLGLTFAAILDLATTIHADEQLFGFVRGAETLPKGRAEVYQFTTLRTGKDSGTYYGLDFDTEVEYGFTDKFQASASLVNHYFYNRNVDGLDNSNGYRFGGGEVSAKYRLLSPFKDPIGLALRLESGYLLHDEVDGLPQHEVYLAPELDLQKNFLDDTLIVDVNLGPEWAWGKLPAEQYPHELSLQAGGGVSYRFAPNWFVGLESRIRAEYPLFDFGNFEHAVVYAGPSIHYSSKRWWATLTWVYQAWGHGVDEQPRGQTFAEETRQAVRVKVGFNF
jgi:opacity protein-like surface antigen